MRTYEVYLTRTVCGRVEVIGESFAEAEKSALMADDDVVWEDADASRDIKQITVKD